MKNALTALFKRKPSACRSVYFTAGYPEKNSTVKILSALETAPIDFIEIGIPFSDPLADGPTIQNSSLTALKNGMTIELLFTQLQRIQKHSSLPKILMGYLNPVLQYGEQRFLEHCKSSGVSGIIIPDLPLDYYADNWAKTCEALHLSVIFLITPETPPDRIRRIDELSSGFIYMVSTNSLTGQKNNLLEQTDYFNRIRAMDLKSPLVIGFGIHDKTTQDFAFQHANGAIIGSAFIRALQDSATLTENINQFFEQLARS